MKKILESPVFLVIVVVLLVFLIGVIVGIECSCTPAYADGIGDPVAAVAARNASIAGIVAAQSTADPTTAPTAESTEEPAADPTTAPTAEPTEEPAADPTTAPTAEPAEPTSEPTEEPTEERFVTTGYGRVKFTRSNEEFFIEIKRRKIDLRKNFNDEEINLADINLSKAEIYDTQTGIVLICEQYFFIEGLGWTRESVSIYDNRVLIGSSDGRCYLYDKEGLKEKKIGSGKVTTLEDAFVYNHECIWYDEIFR